MEAPRDVRTEGAYATQTRRTMFYSALIYIHTARVNIRRIECKTYISIKSRLES